MMSQFVRLVTSNLRMRIARPAVSLSAGAGLSSILSYQAETDLAKPDNSLLLENIGEKWSHKYLLQQSSLLNVESASVTLTQTVVAIQTCSRSYCSHLSTLTSLLTMAHDGLPLAYTSEEMYDKVVELRGILKNEKTALVELGVFFTYMRKLMDSVAETAFLAGAEYASLQAAARLASAELQVKEELGMAERAEQELLVVERENVVKVGKEENQRVKLDTEFVKEEIKKFDNKEIGELPTTEEIKVTVFENEAAKDEEESRFSFERNSDELVKISVREDDDDGNIKITIKEADEDLNPVHKEEDDINSNPYSEYKMPTF